MKAHVPVVGRGKERIEGRLSGVFILKELTKCFLPTVPDTQVHLEILKGDLRWEKVTDESPQLRISVGYVRTEENWENVSWQRKIWTRYVKLVTANIDPCHFPKNCLGDWFKELR